jgi:hypothetical protein
MATSSATSVSARVVVNDPPRPRAGITTAVTIESSDEVDNSEFETRAAHVYVGDKSLGSCTVTWPLPALPDRRSSRLVVPGTAPNPQPSLCRSRR